MTGDLAPNCEGKCFDSHHHNNRAANELVRNRLDSSGCASVLQK